MTVGELLQRLRYYDINTEIALQDLAHRVYTVDRLETSMREETIEPTYGEPPITASRPQLVFVAKERK